MPEHSDIDLKELKRIALAGGAWGVMSTGISALLEFGQSLYLATVLTPSNFGVFTLVLVVTGFFNPFVGFGTGIAIVQRHSLSSVQISTIFWLHIISEVIIVFLLCCISPYLASYLNEPLLKLLIPITASILILEGIGGFFAWLMEKELLFVTLSKQDTFGEIMGCLTTVICAFLKLGVWALVWGYLVKTAVIAILRIFYSWSKWRPQLQFKWQETKEIVSFGLYSMASNAVNVLSSDLDKLIIGAVLGSKELGYYSFVTGRLLAPLTTIGTIMLRNAYPLLAKVQLNQALLQSIFLKMTKYLRAIDAPFLFGTIALAPAAVPLFFGDQWLPVVQLVQILAIAQYLSYAIYGIDILLMVKGRADLSFRWGILRISLNCVAIYTGAVVYGSVGVAVAITLVLIGNILAGYYLFVKKIIGQCGKPFFSALTMPALLASISAYCASLFVQASPVSVSWMIVSMTVCLSSYAAFFWFTEKSKFRFAI